MRYLTRFFVLTLFALCIFNGSFAFCDSLNTELWSAVLKGDIDTVQTLLAKCSDVNERNENGVTLLMVAARYAHSNVVQALLTKGADVNAKSNNGTTVLMNAAGGPRNTTLSYRSGSGFTTLVVSSEEARSEIAQILLAKGADANARDNNGVTALSLAAGNGYLEVVRTLLKKSADVNAKNINGGTALMFSIKNGHKEITELLKKAGAKE